MELIRITIRLNGTHGNPYKTWGLNFNPFPQIPRYEYAHVNALLADLAARPIKDEADLRKRLEGCDPTFISLCCQRFREGKIVEFDVTFPDGPFYGTPKS